MRLMECKTISISLMLIMKHITFVKKQSYFQ